MTATESATKTKPTVTEIDQFPLDFPAFSRAVSGAAASWMNTRFSRPTWCTIQ
jgi:hypothetical protein